MMIRKLIVLQLFIFFTAHAAGQDKNWILVPGSDQKDFQIFCKRGNELVMGIYGNRGTSEYQVARDIYIGQSQDGHTILSFKRGFINADRDTTYVLGQDVTCEESEK